MSVTERNQDRLLSLPEAAARLNLHRASVNVMVHEGRIPAIRVGPHWKVRESDFERFASTYERPRNVPMPIRDAHSLPPAAAAVLEVLLRWDEATTAELGEVISRHPGNIRKGTELLSARGFAVRDQRGYWSLTPAGRAWADKIAHGTG